MEPRRRILRAATLSMPSRPPKKLTEIYRCISQSCHEMEKEGKNAPPVLNEHLFSVEDLPRPTFCSYCSDFIWGLTKQGLKCRSFSCTYVVHKKCQSKSPPNCPVTKHAIVKDPVVRQKVTSMTDVGVAHVFKEARFNKPTWCGFCGNWIKEVLGKQGFKCKSCRLVIHKKCLPGASQQTCTGVTEGPSEVSSPFAEAAGALSLSFAEIIIMVDLFDSVKGQTITQRDGTVVHDCFTGVELVDILVNQNAWKRNQCIHFARCLYAKNVVEPVLNFSSSNFEDTGSFFKFSQKTVSEMRKAVEKRKALLEKEKKLSIVGACLTMLEQSRSCMSDMEKMIQQGLVLPSEVERLVITVSTALSKENVEMNYRKSITGSHFSEYISKLKVIETKLSRADMTVEEATAIKQIVDGLDGAFTLDSLVKFNADKPIYPLKKESDLSWLEKNAPWFKTYFKNQTYVVYYGSLDSGSQVLALLKLEERKTNGGAITILRGLICSDWGIKKVIITDADIIDKTIMANWQNFYHYILQLMAPEFNVTELRALNRPDFDEIFTSYETRDLRTRSQLTTGLVLRVSEQYSEQEMLSNTNGSKAYNEFLSCIGEKIPLQGWLKFKGGLDTTARGANGENSVYICYKDIEIMYHVSTMMPSEDLVTKKRLLHNNALLIVFQEEGCDPFDVINVGGEFIQVIIVVQVLPEVKGKCRYRVEVVRLSGDIPAFGPPLSYPAVFTIGEDFKNALCELIITGHLAIYHSPMFKVPFSASHTASLNELVTHFKKSHHLGDDLERSLTSSFKKKSFTKKNSSLL